MFSHSARRAHGYATIIEPGKSTVEIDTLQCVHCGGHWDVQPGSGIKRGFCTNCGGPHCGGPSCWNCRPFEKWLDTVERHYQREQNFKLMGI